MTKPNKICRYFSALGLTALLGGCGDGRETTGAGDETSTGTPDDSSGPTEPTAETTAETTTDQAGADVECDPKLQDCPDGLRCTAYGKVSGDAWNANKCVAETGSGIAGDPCTVIGPDMFTGIDDCAAGYICLNTEPDGTNGFCVEFCSPDDACPETSAGGGVCLPDGNDGHLPICLQTCDPLVQDCPGTAACYGGDPAWPYVCFAPDPKLGGQDGDGCDFTNACLAGLSCSAQATLEGCAGDAFGCCTPFCTLGQPGCTGEEECTPFYEPQPPGFESVGICTLPG